jgi:subtilisin
MTEEDRQIGIPPDLLRGPDIIGTLSDTEVPPSAWHITDRIRELHRRGVNGKGVTVAVNDTGIGTHPFLGKPVATESFIRGESVFDGNGHGSHCAGIVKSMAPQCDLIAAKVLSNRGSGATTGINNGRVWAAEHGADIISESLGDGGGPPIPQDLAAYDSAYDAGTSICVAALGNAGYNGRSTIGRPGSYSDHNHGIAALTSDWRTIAGFSSGGPQAGYAAPGAGIISCKPRNGWVSMSGTSMATPCQAGGYALVISWRRMLGKADLKGVKQWHEFFASNELIVDLGKPNWDPRFGHGRVDWYKTFDLMLDEIKHL